LSYVSGDIKACHKGPNRNRLTGEFVRHRKVIRAGLRISHSRSSSLMRLGQLHPSCSSPRGLWHVGSSRLANGVQITRATSARRILVTSDDPADSFLRHILGVALIDLARTWTRGDTRRASLGPVNLGDFARSWFGGYDRPASPNNTITAVPTFPAKKKPPGPKSSAKPLGFKPSRGLHAFGKSNRFSILGNVVLGS